MKPDGALAKLLASIGVSQLEAAPAATDEALAALQTEFNTFRATAEGDISELNTALTTALQSVQEVESQRDALAAKLAAFEAAAADAAVSAEKAKAEARMAKIVAVVGTDRADALYQATSSIEDAAFDAVLSAWTVTSTKEAKSEMFTETGVEAEANAAVANSESKEMQILKAKYAMPAAA